MFREMSITVIYENKGVHDVLAFNATANFVKTV